ncbi:hypothetical protein ACQPYE_17515 [Actinosynnema sp. CA-299493]
MTRTAGLDALVTGLSGGQPLLPADTVNLLRDPCLRHLREEKKDG